MVITSRNHLGSKGEPVVNLHLVLRNALRSCRQSGQVRNGAAQREQKWMRRFKSRREAAGCMFVMSWGRGHVEELTCTKASFKKHYLAQMCSNKRCYIELLFSKYVLVQRQFIPHSSADLAMSVKLASIVFKEGRRLSLCLKITNTVWNFICYLESGCDSAAFLCGCIPSRGCHRRSTKTAGSFRPLKRYKRTASPFEKSGL